MKGDWKRTSKIKVDWKRPKKRLTGKGPKNEGWMEKSQKIKDDWKRPKRPKKFSSIFNLKIWPWLILGPALQQWAASVFPIFQVFPKKEDDYFSLSDRWINPAQPSGWQLFFQMSRQDGPPSLPFPWHHPAHWLVGWPCPRQPFLAVITLSFPKGETPKFANANHRVAGACPQAFRCNFYSDLMLLLIWLSWGLSS